MTLLVGGLSYYRCMERFADEHSLTDWLHSEGITVAQAVLPAGAWGAWQPTRRRILIRAGMPDCYKFPALLHETAHYVAGHDGHQSEKIERSINREIAEKLINPVEYEYSELERGWNTPAIAADLGLPRWVVQAYRDVLRRD